MSSVLLAEDDRDIAELVRFKLEQRGHTVRIAENGVQALELFDAEACDVAVLDVMMPKMDGYEVCRRLRERAPTLRILLLTARGREDDVEQGFAAGANDYLVKPFSPRELVSRVDALLAR